MGWNKVWRSETKGKIPSFFSYDIIIKQIERDAFTFLFTLQFQNECIGKYVENKIKY